MLSWGKLHLIDMLIVGLIIDLHCGFRNTLHGYQCLVGFAMFIKDVTTRGIREHPRRLVGFARCVGFALFVGFAKFVGFATARGVREMRGVCAIRGVHENMTTRGVRDPV